MSSRLAIASLVSQSASSIILFCRYHFQLGVEHIFLFFDYPEEADIPELRSDPRVTITVCDGAFWKRLNIERVASLRDRNSAVLSCGFIAARDAGYTYVALIDSDELLYVDRSLDAALADAFANADVAYLYPEEAIHDHASIQGGDFSHRCFKVRTNRLNRMLAPFFYFRNKDVSDEGFLGHLLGKNIFLTSVGYKTMHMHNPILEDRFKRNRTKSIILLHFDCMDFDEWKKKWAMRFSGMAIPDMRDKRARQYEQIRAATARGDSALRALYERYYLFRTWQLRLGQMLGLIHKPSRLGDMLERAQRDA